MFSARVRFETKKEAEERGRAAHASWQLQDTASDHAREPSKAKELGQWACLPAALRATAFADVCRERARG